MGLRSPVVAVHYRGNLAALCPWLPDGVACLDHVNRWRWPDGLRYTQCGREKGWPLTGDPQGPARGVQKPDRTAALWVLVGVGTRTWWCRRSSYLLACCLVGLFCRAASAVKAARRPPRRYCGQRVRGGIRP
jgi:hypothetical protein